ncbi:hypothetical protein P171DRAFT_428512 [Karstenula rhodostoma CBS 690.94]|uniref:Uncharacterized protein n=1 Tax=Karstenula rhodostoma CBS 690.94 TaxID=1392251 RepID=A0A9P4UGE1_9PLEO|nr:hypothetical protein P171DRAFT_428512 [Karstenula rhodostoma CBS 690.94]
MRAGDLLSSHLVCTSLPAAEALQSPALTFGVPFMAVSTATCCSLPPRADARNVRHARNSRPLLEPRTGYPALDVVF